MILHIDDGVHIQAMTNTDYETGFHVSIPNTCLIIYLAHDAPFHHPQQDELSFEALPYAEQIAERRRRVL